MEKLGYSYEQLKKVNPGIIYCSISGFGQDSPMRDLPAYDIVAQGMSGMMSITGYPNTPPARVGSSLGDVSAGLYLSLIHISTTMCSMAPSVLSPTPARLKSMWSWP